MRQKKNMFVYNSIVSDYYTIDKHLKNKEININENDDIVVFVSCFSTGTIHGYTFVLHAINEYIQKYRDKKILIFKKSQKGILDLINYIVPENKIIEIVDHQLYKINRGIFIPNTIHNWHKNSLYDFQNIIRKYFMIPDYNKYNDLLHKNICIIKK